MPTTSPDLSSLIARAEALLARLEAVLPHPPAAPDWAASIAFRYRKRGGSGVLEPVRHVAPIRLDGAGRGRAAEGAPGAQHRAVRRRPWGQQRAADRRARHRQELADQGLPERVRAARAAPDRGRQGRPGRPARHRRPGRRAARALHRVLRRPQLRRGRARLQGAQVDPRRLGRAGQRQRADLRHQQPPPPAARVHEGEPDLPAHRGRRSASRRGRRGEDLAVRALRPVGQLLPVHAGRVPGHRRAVAARLRRRRGGDRRGAPGEPGLGARARFAFGPGGVPVRQGLRRAGTTRERCRRRPRWTSKGRSRAVRWTSRWAC